MSTVAAPRPLATAAAVLAFDFGTRRIGVAVGDRGVGIAHPVTTIEGEDNASEWNQPAVLNADTSQPSSPLSDMTASQY